MMASRVTKSLLMVCALIMSACTTKPPAEEERPSKVEHSKAINMDVPHKQGEAYSLYGIALGESRDSVEEKYRLVACRKDVFYTRCATLLDTTGVIGAIHEQKATMFLAFNNGQTHIMTMIVSAASLEHTKSTLYEMYGQPLVEGKKSVWRNASGQVILEENVSNQSASLTYTAES